MPRKLHNFSQKYVVEEAANISILPSADIKSETNGYIEGSNQKCKSTEARKSTQQSQEGENLTWIPTTSRGYVRNAAYNERPGQQTTTFLETHKSTSRYRESPNLGTFPTTDIGYKTDGCNVRQDWNRTSIEPHKSTRP